MRNTIKSICLNQPNEVEIREISVPKKADNEVLIKVESMGICGSDIGAYRGANPLVTYPKILGHELAGTILETGIGMPENIKVGDRVVIEPYIFCGECYPCRIGRTNCCQKLQVNGVHIDGGMQEVFAHPAHLIHKVPDNISLEYLPLAEPLSIALHALHRTKVREGEYIAIIGAGAIGLMAALASKNYGAIPILIDILDERLSYANSLDIPYIINPTKEDAESLIATITNGQMAQVVVEASGANIAVQNTLKYASFAGRIALTGWPKMETPLPTNIITFKELNIYGSRTSKGEFEEALELLSQREIKAEAIVSKVISFAEIPAYIKALSDTPEKYLKINAIF